MSDTDGSPFEILDLIEANTAELAQFAARCHVSLEKLERCQRYLKSVAPFDGGVEVWLFEPPGADPMLAIRHRRGDYVTRLEVPHDFPTKYLLRLLEIIHET